MDIWHQQQKSKANQIIISYEFIRALQGYAHQLLWLSAGGEKVDISIWGILAFDGS